MRIRLAPGACAPRRSRSGPVAALALLTLMSVALATGPASADRPPAARAERISPALQEFPPGTPASHLPKAVAWGNNNFGALGDGSVTARLSPVVSKGGAVLDATEVSIVDTGLHHTCAVADSAAYCWGDNADGQLGIGNALTATPDPTLVGGLLSGKSVTAISAGGAHTCAIAGGSAYCWGSNDSGQLGNGSTQDASLPVKVSGLSDTTVTAISAGDQHTCAIADATAYCWGADQDGQLGDGLGQPKQTTPVAVNTLSGLAGRIVDSITTGDLHTCASVSGKGYCWGNNDHGQLGDGTLNTSTVPVAIVASTGVISIAAGGNSSCAVVRPQSKQIAGCWGAGAGGTLGNGGTNDHPIPTVITAGGKFLNTKVSAISMSASGGCVLEDNRAYCWGDSTGFGRLGTDGNPKSSTVPVQVVPTDALSGRITLAISTHVERTAGVAVTTPTFTDVNTAHPFRSEITWLAGTGTARGYDDGKYQPGTDIDRQAMAAFLFRYTNPGQPDPTCDPKKDRIFTDVHTTDTFCGPIEWLTTAGVNPLQGITPPGGWKFRPLDPTRRDTMASWLFRTHHPDMTDPICIGMARLFPDVSAGNSSCGAIEWLARAGITTGYDNGTYQPTASVARQSMAAFLRRLNALTSH